MNEAVMGAGRQSLSKVNIIAPAVRQHQSKGRKDLLERAFSFAFRGLVYAQIWEDPVVDMEGLALTPDSRVMTIASGGCNVLSYLVANPAHIQAVDLNTAHIALNRLKLAAVQHLPDYEHFRRFFVEADCPENIAAYRRYIAPHLDAFSRRYWEGRDLRFRQRISGFQKGFYRRGLLGQFIGLAHLAARLYRVNPEQILASMSREQQREFFDTKLAPLFERKFIRWLTSQPASLFGLGIPPAQFEVLAGGETMADVLRNRLEKLACNFDIRDNYFAWQAFGRGYGRNGDAPLPPYLQKANYPLIRERIGRVDVSHANFGELLAQKHDQELDAYVLLDAQDWMSDQQLNALWSQITRTARPGARVLFRTAAVPDLLPGRVNDDVLAQWDYQADMSRDLGARDRSSIYGGVHVYEKRGG